MGVLAGYTVAMVIYCATNMCATNITCSPMVAKFFDTMIMTPSDKEWLY